MSVTGHPHKWWLGGTTPATGRRKLQTIYAATSGSVRATARAVLTLRLLCFLYATTASLTAFCWLPLLSAREGQRQCRHKGPMVLRLTAGQPFTSRGR